MTNTAASRTVDTIIRNATVIDGLGTPGRRGTILVRDGKITEVLYDSDAAGVGSSRVIDGEGLTASPGFIDTHIHTDVDLLWDRQHAPTLMQGITTHILGQDGLSYAPLTRENLDRYKRYLAPVNGIPPISWDWSSVAEFRDRFDGTVAPNTAYEAPHGTVRFQVNGMSNSPLTGAELCAARNLLRVSFDEGAVAFSTGLSYFPGSFANTDELTSLCEIAAEYDLPYVTHLRSVFLYGDVDPVDEAIEIARRSGARLHLSHYRTTPKTVGRVDEVLSKVDAAYQDGLDVTLDTYPYIHGSGPLYIGLPPWAFEGGIEDTLARLADPRQRQALIQGIEENTAEVGGCLTHVPRHPEYEGREVGDVAEERGQSVPDLVCDLLLDAELDVTFHLGTAALLNDLDLNARFERDVLEVLDRPYTMIGSDGIYVGRRPHERAFGTFPKLLRLAREHSFPLEKLINRMTGAAAQTFALDGRGTLKPGAAADIVLFDAQTVAEGATAANPRRGPRGIHTVLVNGEVALDKGQVTGLLPGRALAPHSATR